MNRGAWWATVNYSPWAYKELDTTKHLKHPSFLASSWSPWLTHSLPVWVLFFHSELHFLSDSVSLCAFPSVSLCLCFPPAFPCPLSPFLYVVPLPSSPKSSEVSFIWLPEVRWGDDSELPGGSFTFP